MIGFTIEKHEINFLKQAKSYFTFEDKSLCFIGGSYDPRKVKRISFMREKDGCYLLPAGFLKELLIIAKKNNVKLNELSDKREKFPHQEKEWSEEEIASYFPFKYNNHQIRAMKKLLKVNLGIISATTSAGKSSIFSAFIRMTKLPTLVLVNKVTLAEQLARNLIKDGIENVGLYHGKSKRNGDVVVATIGSVKKIPDLHKFKVLVGDEVHRFQSKEFQRFLSVASYPIRIGFSATPEGNGDEYKWATIRQYFGTIIEKIEAKELLDNGVIARPQIKFINISCKPTMDWPSAYQQAVVLNDDRNRAIKNLCEDNPVPTLVLVRIIEHGESLEREIPGSFFVSGKHSPKEREEAIEKFSNGEIQVLIASNIFNEGISINAIRQLIITSGYKGRIETLQRLGRVLRLDDGKIYCTVYDFNDIGNFFTEKHSKIRRNLYIKAGFEVIK